MEKPGSNANLSMVIVALACSVIFFLVPLSLRPFVIAMAAVALVFLLPKSTAENKVDADEQVKQSHAEEVPALDSAPPTGVNSSTSTQSHASLSLKPDEKAADYLRAASASPGARALAAAMKAKATAAAAKAAARPITGAVPPSASSSAPGKAAGLSTPSGVAVLYGSQTGNAMEIAKTIHAEAVKRGLAARLAALNDFGLERLREVQAAVLVVSSTGDGDPPENCDRVAHAVQRRSQPRDLLAHLHFCVCGLGDSNYTRFMAVPRIFSRRLPELGARPFYRNVEADEVEGLDDIVEQWAEGLWEPLAAALATPLAAPAPVAAAAEAEPSEEPLVGVPPLQPCRVRLQWLDAAPGSAVAAELASLQAQVARADNLTSSSPGAAPFSHANPFPARVLHAAYLTPPSSDRTVISVRLAAPPASAMALQAGDSLAVLPRNSPALVDALLARLGWQEEADRPFALADLEGAVASQEVAAGESAGSKLELGGSVHQPSAALSHLPAVCTLRAALLLRCDVTGVARKSLLRVLAEHCAAPAERRRLLLLASRGGRDAYRAAVADARPGLLELLQAFPSCRPPPAELLDALPPLGPRMYSLASSPRADAATCEFVFSVVSMRLPSAAAVAVSLPAAESAEQGAAQRLFEGVCTSWLEGLLPLDSESRQQRLAARREGLLAWVPGAPAEAEAGGAGSSSSGGDHCFLPVYHKPGGSFKHPESLAAPLLMIGPGTGVAPFRGFLQERRARRAEEGGEAGEAWLFFGCRRREEDYLFGDELEAFERDGTLSHLVVAFSRQTKEKVYVQHRMAQHGAQLAALLRHPEAHVFVCGDGAQMVKDVHTALLRVLQEHLQVQESTAVAQLAAMVAQGRYIRDVWS